jgi:hypothetical protein
LSRGGRSVEGEHTGIYWYFYYVAYIATPS